MSKQALKKLPAMQAIQALRKGPGAESLPSSVKVVTMSYVANRATKGVSEFATTTLPRLAYANPLIRFTVDRKPSPRTKAKDPEIIKRAEDAAAEESASPEAKKERRTPRMIIEFEGRANKTIDLTGLPSSNILQALQSVQA